MKKQILSIAAAMLAVVPQLAAQQDNNNQGGRRGNFDPAEARERMMGRLREQMEVPKDDEWKLISDRIQKVNDSRVAGGGGFGAFGGGRGGPGGRPPGAGEGAPGGGGGGQGQGRRGGSPELDELRQAIEDKAAPDVIKAKLAKVRDARKTNEAKLEKAQTELKEVLSVRQEAVAVMYGLLR